jgi:hypothetical protein
MFLDQCRISGVYLGSPFYVVTPRDRHYIPKHKKVTKNRL